MLESFARVGYFVDRILDGATATLPPIEQPTSLELAVNLKTARQLRVSGPHALLVRAERVIE